MISTHIYGVSKETDEKTFSFQSKPWHVNSQINHLRKSSPVLRVSTHIYWVSKKTDGKTFSCYSKLRHVTPQIDHLSNNELCSDDFNTHLWCFQGDR